MTVVAPDTTSHGALIQSSMRKLLPGFVVLVLVSCVPYDAVAGSHENPVVLNAPGPIVITRGGTYTGSIDAGTMDRPVIEIRTTESVVIKDAFLRGRGDLIRVPRGVYADLTIQNVVGEVVPQTAAGRFAGRFLYADSYARVVVEDSTLLGTSGIYLHASSSGATVRIVRNRALNIDGRLSDGAGGYAGVYFVQFVQFNRGSNLRDSEVAWNEVVNEPYRSRVEDVISLYQTSGRPGDPVRIHNNFIRGAYPADPARDTYSGGGIMLGDEGGSYLHAYENHVVSTSNYGIAIAGGSHNRIDDNRVVSCGVLPDGSRIAAQNVGIYVWNVNGSGGFTANGGSGNLAGWAHPTSGRNDMWVPDASTWDDNRPLQPPGAVSCDLETLEYERWLDKVRSNGFSIGANSTR